MTNYSWNAGMVPAALIASHSVGVQNPTGGQPCLIMIRHPGRAMLLEHSSIMAHEPPLTVANLPWAGKRAILM